MENRQLNAMIATIAMAMFVILAGAVHLQAAQSAPLSSNTVSATSTSVSSTSLSTSVSSTSVSSTSLSTSASSTVPSTSISTVLSTVTTTIEQTSNSYTLLFYSIPSTGVIDFNNTTCYSGNMIQETTGNYPISAIAPENFVFNDWSYSGNVAVASLNSSNTIISIFGNGSVTANFNALTTFSENGLPANVVWSVAYNGIEQNAIAPSSIIFSSMPGNYLFGTNDIVNNATTYIPTQQYGYLIAGNTTEINFIPAPSNTTTSISTSTSTLLTTSSTSITTTASTSTTISMTTPPTPIKVQLGGRAVPVIVQNHHTLPIIVSGGILKRINVNFNSNVNFNIRVNVMSPPNPKFYKEIIISENTTVDPYVSSVEYNFSVPISFAINHSISSSNIKLFKNVSNGWQALPTNYLGTNGTYYFYSAVSDSLSTYAVGFTTNSSTSVTPKDSVSLNVVGTYRAYLWAGGSEAVATNPMTALTCGSWSINANTLIDDELCAPSAMTPMSNVTVIANSTSNSALFSGDSNSGGADNYTVLAGIGANVIMANKAFAVTNKTSPSVTFTTVAANSVVFLLFATSGEEIKSLSLPTSCKQQVLANVSSTFGSAAIANCFIATPGLYSASATWAGTTGKQAASAAAIGFSPYIVTFEDSLSSGTITAEGQTYTNDQSSNIIGTGNIIANPPTGYQFAKWIVSNSNITFGSLTSSSTTFTVEGNGTVTALYIKPTPVSITFNDSPTNGYMVVNGITETNGAINTLITGTQYTANAIAPAGFNFVKWVFYPSANAIISNSISPNTYITVYGTGTLKAFFSPPAVNLGVGIKTNNVTSTTPSDSASLNVGGAYRAYLWGGGSEAVATNPMTALTCGSWSINANTLIDDELCAPSAMTPMSNVTVIANSTSNSALFSGDSNSGGADNYTVLAGIGANVIMANKAFAVTNKTSPSVTFTTVAANSVVFLLFATSGEEIKSLSLPTSCKQQVLANVSSTFGSAAIANCFIATPGLYSASATWAGTTGKQAASAAAIGFSPYAVTLNDSPSTGTISVAGSTYQNGVIVPIIGTGTITANTPLTGSWSFNSWSVSNSINLSIANTLSPSTSLTVMGNGTITATWNGISKFIETGLPSATTWNVIYNSVINSSSTNTISFSTLPGNYPFTIANQIVSGVTYTPSPSNGYLVAGNTTTITFSPAHTCTVFLPVDAVNFGKLNAGSSIATTNSITDDNTGNANAYMFIYGGNWIGPGSMQFGVSNTTWASSNGVPFASADKMSANPANTLLLISAQGSNTIYLGLEVPNGAPAGPYSQTITIENSC